MSTLGLYNVLIFCGLMVGAVFALASWFKRLNAKDAARDAERIKRAGQL